jgi:hypothetical protein
VEETPFPPAPSNSQESTALPTQASSLICIALTPRTLSLAPPCGLAEAAAALLQRAALVQHLARAAPARHLVVPPAPPLLPLQGALLPLLLLVVLRSMDSVVDRDGLARPLAHLVPAPSSTPTTANVSHKRLHDFAKVKRTREMTSSLSLTVLFVATSFICYLPESSCNENVRFTVAYDRRCTTI